LASLTVTKAQLNAGYRILLETTTQGVYPTGTITSAYFGAEIEANDIKAVLNYRASTGILTLPTSAWDSSGDYSAPLKITMSTGEVFTIEALNYDAP
jgi:hypothetical protein